MFELANRARALGVFVSFFSIWLFGCEPEEQQAGACPSSTLGCPCADAGQCGDTLACNIDAGLCEMSSDCAVFGCGPMQLCGVPDAGLQTECLPECESGATWVDRLSRCVANPARCDDKGPGSPSAVCEAEHRLCLMAQDGPTCVGCQAGFVEELDKCVAVKRCDDLECAALGRACIEATDRADAECSECRDGYREVEGLCAREVCEVVPAVGETRSRCGEEQRVCRENGGVVYCDGCFPGFTEVEGRCRATRTCAELGCAQQERLCTAASEHEDAQCGACRSGFVDANGECQARVGAKCDGSAESISDACLAEHRSCNAESANAFCGDCEAGYVWDEALGVCAEKKLCSALDCAAENRGCENFPNAHCTACLTGFTENPEDGTCRAVVGCAALSCTKGSICVAGASPLGDAACSPDCGPGSVWNGLRCESCPPCNAAGESGRYPTPTRAGYCICRTDVGYFYSTAGDVGTRRCDADGDGWVRESARLAFASSDPVLAQNARCDVRVIDRFVLENERAQTQEVFLEKPLPLFESDRNDDDAMLQAIFQARGLPEQLGEGANARLPRASELNRLTKLCHHVRTDYNDNGAFDVSEWGEAPLSPVLTVEQQPFNRFSYFAELHQGYYVAKGAADAYGHYRIVERPRAPAGGNPPPGSLALTYAVGSGDTWRTCARDRDAQFGQEGLVPVGLDLATYYTPPLDPYLSADQAFGGMMHHSQFKCLALSNVPDVAVPTSRRPSELSEFDLNTCVLAGEGTPLGQGSNAVAANLSCTTLAATDAKVDAGAVLWGAVKYRDHGPWGAPANQLEYVRGCRNGCYGELSGCEGFNTNPRSVTCDYDVGDFGRFVSCAVGEVCDGIDNDENPATPDGSGDPLLNASCEPPGKLGECLLQGGRFICQSAAPWLVCQPNFVAQADEIACDGRDEDCNGFIDDGDPGNDGATCLPNAEEFEIAGLGPESRFGECAKGRRGRCSNGRNLCEVVNLPQAEICGNGLDDDCDGVVDESEMLLANGTAILAAYGVNNQPSCTMYYRDKDGDDFGTNLEGLCLCRPASPPAVHAVEAANAPLPGKYVLRSDARNDCCDTGPTDGSNQIYPGATGWLSSIGPCGNYDKDCNGDSEQEYRTSGARNCDERGVGCWTSSHSPCCQDAECNPPVVGWDGAPPICGSSGQFFTGGCGCGTSGTRCNGTANTETRTQRCR